MPKKNTLKTSAKQLTVKHSKKQSQALTPSNNQYNIQGYIDKVQQNCIEGWVLNKNDINKNCIVIAIQNNQIISETDADIFREDLIATGISNGHHGFRLLIPTEILISEEVEILEKESKQPINGSPIKLFESLNTNNLTTPLPDIDLDPLDQQMISNVEPFLECQLDEMRSKLINDALVEQARTQVINQLVSPTDPNYFSNLVHLLAQLKAENHYLKAAYIESSRYKEPNFEIKTPDLPKKIRLKSLKINLCGEITGSNWFNAEADGRWAGPESESSILCPALGFGQYKVAITIENQITPNIIDDMVCTLNKQEIKLLGNSRQLPSIFTATVKIDENYLFPFWSLKFHFKKLESPSSQGSEDQRMLAIMVRSIEFNKVD